MTKDELVKFLNEMAASLNMTPITKRILSDWIDEGLLDGSVAVGHEIGKNPTWHLSEETIEYAKLLTALRSFGATRANILRLYLWLFGRDAHPDLVRQALNSEYKRVMQRYRRTNTWTYDGNSRNVIRDQKYQKLLSKVSKQLDPVFKEAGFEVPADIALELGSAANLAARKEDVISLLVAATRKMGLVPLDQEQQLRQHIENNFNSLVLPGILADPDETTGSVEEHLGQLNTQDLTDGRIAVLTQILTLVQVYLLNGPLAEQRSPVSEAAYLRTLRSLVRPNWITLYLGGFSVGAYRARVEKS